MFATLLKIQPSKCWRPKIYAITIFLKTGIRISKELDKNKNIVVTTPGNSRGVIIMNRKNYDRIMNDILAGRTTFKIFEPNEDVYNYALKKVNRILEQLRDKNIAFQQYHNMFSSSTGLGIMYGTPKIHKPGISLHPILAAHNTATYKLAKFSAQLLESYTTKQYRS